MPLGYQKSVAGRHRVAITDGNSRGVFVNHSFWRQVAKRTGLGRINWAIGGHVLHHRHSLGRGGWPGRTRWAMPWWPHQSIWNCLCRCCCRVWRLETSLFTVHRCQTPQPLFFNLLATTFRGAMRQRKFLDCIARIWWALTPAQNLLQIDMPCSHSYAAQIAHLGDYWSYPRNSKDYRQGSRGCRPEISYFAIRQCPI